VRLSPHTAQASDNVPARYDPARLRRPTTPLRQDAVAPLALGSTWALLAAVPATDVITVAAVAPAKGHYTPADLSASLPESGWLTLSRPPTPQGSLPAFAWGDVAWRRNPYPTHYRPAFAFSLISYPQPRRLVLRLAFPEGGLRAYHVALLKPRGLGPACTPVARHLRRVGPSHPDLATYLLVQAYQHLWLVPHHDANGSSPGLTIPRTARPQPPGAGSRGPGSRPRRHPKGEDTFFRGLRTPPLPGTHASVADRWQNSGCCHLLSEEQHSFSDTLVSQADNVGQALIVLF